MKTIPKNYLIYTILAWLIDNDKNIKGKLRDAQIDPETGDMILKVGRQTVNVNIADMAEKFMLQIEAEVNELIGESMPLLQLMNSAIHSKISGWR